MKNLFFVLLALLLMGCSKDDNSKEPDNTNWTISIQQECPGGEKLRYCASEEEWNRVDGMIVVGEPCNWVSFTDTGGTRRSGYFRTAATGSNPCN